MTKMLEIENRLVVARGLGWVEEGRRKWVWLHKGNNGGSRWWWNCSASDSGGGNVNQLRGSNCIESNTEAHANEDRKKWDNLNETGRLHECWYPDYVVGFAICCHWDKLDKVYKGIIFLTTPYDSTIISIKCSNKSLYNIKCDKFAFLW